MFDPFPCLLFSKRAGNRNQHQLARGAGRIEVDECPSRIASKGVLSSRYSSTTDLVTAQLWLQLYLQSQLKGCSSVHIVRYQYNHLARVLQGL